MSSDAERIESLQAELAEARAVIEQVGAEATRHSEVVDGCVRVETAYVTQVLSAYRAAPSSALDAEPTDPAVEAAGAVLYAEWDSFDFENDDRAAAERELVRTALKAARES